MNALGTLILLPVLAGGAQDLEPLADLERRCDVEAHGASCYKAAVRYGFGMGVEKDLVKAAARYERSCKLGVWLGCHDTAVMYERGEAVAKDEAKAKAYYAEELRLMEKACAAGNKMTCTLLERWRKQGLLPGSAPPPRR
jgi:hypothetical protein